MNDKQEIAKYSHSITKPQLKVLKKKIIPIYTNKRIVLLSSDEQTFKESTPIYQNALRHSNFDHEFTYTQDASQRTRIGIGNAT